jgi:hypothetical protein
MAGSGSGVEAPAVQGQAAQAPAAAPGQGQAPAAANPFDFNAMLQGMMAVREISSIHFGLLLACVLNLNVLVSKFFGR